MNHYICENCGNVFQQTITDEQANAEYQATFPDEVGEATATVCEVCYKKIMDWVKEGN